MTSIRTLQARFLLAFAHSDLHVHHDFSPETLVFAQSALSLHGNQTPLVAEVFRQANDVIWSLAFGVQALRRSLVGCHGLQAERAKSVSIFIPFSGRAFTVLLSLLGLACLLANLKWGNLDKPESQEQNTLTFAGLTGPLTTFMCAGGLLSAGNSANLTSGLSQRTTKGRRFQGPTLSISLKSRKLYSNMRSDDFLGLTWLNLN